MLLISVTTNGRTLWMPLKNHSQMGAATHQRSTCSCLVKYVSGNGEMERENAGIGNEDSAHIIPNFSSIHHNYNMIETQTVSLPIGSNVKGQTAHYNAPVIKPSTERPSAAVWR